MTPRFWLFSLASAGAALVSGLGLGLYATTPPRVAMADIEAPLSMTDDGDESAYPADQNGPRDIRCSGCGPTLAQRQMVAMTGGWNGYDDPVLRDYVARTDEQPEDLLPDQADPPPSPVHQRPANIERFAADQGSAQPVHFAQGQSAATDMPVDPSGSF